MKVPQFLYHRTTERNLPRIVLDGMLKCCGTSASNGRFQEAKFDKAGNDKWRCVFLADSIDMTTALTWGGNVVLKISTKNLDESSFEQDGEANVDCFTHSFKYFKDIPFTEVAEIIQNKWRYP